MLKDRSFTPAVLLSGAIALACSGKSRSDGTVTHGSSGLGGTSGGSGGAGGRSGNQGGSTAQGGSENGGSGGGGAGSAGRGGKGGTSTGAGSGGAGDAGADGLGGTSGLDAGGTGVGGDAGESSGAGGNGTGGAAGSTAGGAAGSAGSPGSPVCQPDCGSHKWACWPMPNPVGSGLPNEASYTDNGETVVDDVTCLEWQKEQPDDRVEWVAAFEYCDDLTLGGQSDWRLPTRIELLSVARIRAGVDTSVFAQLKGLTNWTASIDAASIIQDRAPGAREVWFWRGDRVDLEFEAGLSHVRCVRGGGVGEDAFAFAAAPADQYAEAGPGEIRDNYTGLVWQQGQSNTLVPPADAEAYCASLALGGHAWRLPGPEELSTLVDEARNGDAINLDVFPVTDADVLSRTPYWALGSGPQIYGLWFFYGFVYDDDHLASLGITEGLVRCVR